MLSAGAVDDTHKTISFLRQGSPALETEAVLKIDILDSNDNPPTCQTEGVHCEIPEHASSLVALSSINPNCRFECTDPDSEKFGEMVFSPDLNSEDCFIDVDGAGEIRLTKDLDLESLDRVAFICTVKVRDAGNPAFEISR